MRSIFLMISLLCLGPKLVSGQGDVMSSLDREILKVLVSDPLSSAHMFLASERTFGIQDLAPEDHLVMVKMRDRVEFISQQSGAVYRSASTDGPLVRIDRHNVFGLEYRVDAFARKDSLFMVATSKFMKGKGFLAFFDTTENEWKPYRGNEHVIKESTLPYYDAANDQLYVVCNYAYDDKVDSASATMDNVLRFSFSSGTWEELGRLENEVFTSAVNVPMHMNWVSPFGAGNFEGGDLNVLQMDMNRWLSTDPGFGQGMLTTIPALADTSNVLQLLYMGDTLYAFNRVGSVIQVGRMALHESDFTITGGKALYEQVADDAGTKGGNMVLRWGIMLSGLAVLFFAVYQFRRRPADKANVPQPVVVTSAIPTIAPVSIPEQPAKLPVHYFLGSLNPVELGLVKELSRYAMKDSVMDTHVLNQILGVSHKEPELQKVRRSLTITRINSNFAQMLEPDTALIRRAKDPADKRVFLYYVTKEHAQMLLAADEGSIKDQSSSSK